MKKFVILLAISLGSTIQVNSQGCVAIRNIGGVSPDLLFKNIGPNDRYILNVTNRYFEASQSFRGDEPFSDTLVTNRIYTINIALLRLFNNGWSLGLNLPISANSRHNGADHKGPLTFPKYTTHAFGLGDLRLSVYKWLINPSKNVKGNVQLGLGIKLPTGDYDYKDYFVRNDTTKVFAPVDQAIQLGDGGTGFTTELNAFYSFGKVINLYIQGFYLINPREQNGVSNLKGRNPTQVQINNNTTVMSVPDQFSFRGGANFQLQDFVLTAGLRYEKVPSNDLIGGNKGFRRVATIASVEPGITYKLKSALAFVYLGIPFERNIVLNTQNDMTPAAFADMVISFGLQFKL